MIQAVGITGLAGLALSAYVGFVAYGKGGDAERLIWEVANVETLVLANTGLADAMKAQDDEIDRLRNLDIETGSAIEEQTAGVIERIRYVPVEKIIKVASDCRVGYGLVSLRNSWAKGDSFSERAEQRADGYIPFVGANPVRDNSSTD